MSEKETIDNNTLIAQYMGYQHFKSSYGGWGVATDINDMSTWIPIEQLKYHSSYDALMPVVHKIFNTTDELLKAFEGLGIFEIGLTTPLDEIYQEVVNYINWYNENKDNQ